MNTNIVISLDTRRTKKDGTFPVVMRLGHNKRTTSIPTGISVLEKDWDAKNRQVKKSYVGVSSVSRLNNIIQKKKAKAMDVIFKLNEAGQLNTMSITALRDRVEQNGASLSFFKFTAQEIEELIKAGRIGTARSFKGVSDVLSKYLKGRDLLFQEINFSFLTKFEAFHLSKGNSYNGLSVYIRAVRSLFNKAIKAGLVEKDLYPFDDYKIKSVPTQKRALDWEYIKKIIEKEIEPGELCFHARNYFLASYMMYGMNFTDMAYLKKEDIKNGRIKYRRRKTSKLYDIKLTDNLEKILLYYINQEPENEYVFPIINRATPMLQSKDIQWARKRYNKKLKELATLCEIPENLTSYVSRHSFATQAMLKEVPLNAISAMLGHSSLKTTEIYLKSLPTNVLDNYNDLVINGE
ncbi:MAG: site-specific integrase [Bacteroidetes bacterium]|nr:MAG: site-specific integrase [Bacteroidota bacterium]